MLVIRETHSETFIQCTPCSEYFVWSSNVSQHMQSMHNTIDEAHSSVQNNTCYGSGDTRYGSGGTVYGSGDTVYGAHSSVENNTDMCTDVSEATEEVRGQVHSFIVKVEEDSEAKDSDVQE